MDTTSNALSLIFSFLADHPEAQEKLRAEILEVMPEDGDFDYDTLVNLPYLDAVCRETLRLYVHLQTAHPCRTRADVNAFCFYSTTPIPLVFRE